MKMSEEEDYIKDMEVDNNVHGMAEDVIHEHEVKVMHDMHVNDSFIKSPSKKECLQAQGLASTSTRSKHSSGYNSNTSEEDGCLQSQPQPHALDWIRSLESEQREKLHKLEIKCDDEKLNVKEVEEIQDLVIVNEDRQKPSTSTGTDGITSTNQRQSGIVKFDGISIMEQILESQYPIDTVLSCADGKIGAHKMVLMAASPFLKFLLKDDKLEDRATIVLPDISLRVVKIILQFCYNGEVVFPPELLDEVYAAMEELLIGVFADWSLKNVLVSSSLPQPTTTTSDSSSNFESQTPNQCTSATATSVVAYTDVSEESDFAEPEPDPEKAEIIEDPKFKEIVAAVVITREDGEGDCYHCTTCDAKLVAKSYVINHIKSQHRRELRWVVPSSTEYDQLSFCSICNKQHATVFAADECLKKHSSARCYTCFGVFSYDDLMKHYTIAHGMNSKHGLVSPCRWCGIGVSISKTGKLLHRHAKFSHLSKVGYPKKLKPAAVPSPSTVRRGRTSKPSTNKITKNNSNASNCTRTRGRASSNSGIAVTEYPLASSSSIPVPTSIMAGPLHPFFQKFQENIELSFSKQVANPEPEPIPIKKRGATPVPDPIPVKKRKLDKNGSPLQLAKRTGVPVGRRMNKLLPNMKFTKGTFILINDPITGKISNLNINELPQVRVHVSILTEEVHNPSNKYSNNNYTQDSPTTTPPIMPQLLEPEKLDADKAENVEYLDSFNNNDDPSVHDADTQIIDPFEVTKTIPSQYSVDK